MLYNKTRLFSETIKDALVADTQQGLLLLIASRSGGQAVKRRLDNRTMVSHYHNIAFKSCQVGRIRYTTYHAVVAEIGN